MTLEHWIEYPSEPKELLLAWEAPLSVVDRARWAVGRLRKAGDEVVFHYLKGETFAALNLGRSWRELEAAGFGGYPAFDMGKNPVSGFRAHVLETFSRRVPSSKRSDFAQYLAHHRVKPSMPLSPLALLAVTEARLPGDGFSLIDPLDPETCRVDLVFEVAGVRHHARHAALVGTGDVLDLEREPSNSTDPDAVRVKAAGQAIGYVNHLQAATIGGWLRRRTVSCCVARLGMSPDARRIYAFLRVRPAEHAIAA